MFILVLEVKKMTLKNYKMVGAILIFLLCFPFHSLYDWLPNSLFSLFFPVNESIWEHMKLLFTPFVVYTIIEYLFLRKYEKINNIIFGHANNMAFSYIK